MCGPLTSGVTMRSGERSSERMAPRWKCRSSMAGCSKTTSFSSVHWIVSGVGRRGPWSSAQRSRDSASTPGSKSNCLCRLAAARKKGSHRTRREPGDWPEATLQSQANTDGGSMPMLSSSSPAESSSSPPRSSSSSPAESSSSPAESSSSPVSGSSPSSSRSASQPSVSAST